MPDVFAHRIGLHTHGRAGALHQRLVERSLRAQEDRDADHAFGADDANFERRAIFHHGEQGNDAVIRK